MKKIYQEGFTLIELLVASAIIITATTVVVAILASSFRGVNKATFSEEVRQNGNSAISRMSRMLQFAESFQGASQTGNPPYSDCVSGAGLSYRSIKIKSSNQTKILSCGGLDLSIIDSSGTSSLIDTSKVNVVANSCRFTCQQASSGDTPIIGINFDLTEANSSVPDKTATIKFSTTVKMRNL